MADNQPRVLIVGDGLAGCLVAWELHRRGCSFAVWSNGSPAASDVAAGMFNPVSFKRILPQWNAREQQDEARARYEWIGAQIGKTLWEQKNIVPDTPFTLMQPGDQIGLSSNQWNPRFDQDTSEDSFTLMQPGDQIGLSSNQGLAGAVAGV